MSLNLLAIQDQIIVKLNELPQDVYETNPPERLKLKFSANGTLLPYIVVQFSDPYPDASAGGIISTKYDVGRSYVIVSCMGPTERSSRQVAGAVREKLTGFAPSDAGEMRLFGGSTGYTTQNSKQNIYATDITFTFPANTVW